MCSWIYKDRTTGKPRGKKKIYREGLCQLVKRWSEEIMVNKDLHELAPPSWENDLTVLSPSISFAAIMNYLVFSLVSRLEHWRGLDTYNQMVCSYITISNFSLMLNLKFVMPVIAAKNTAIIIISDFVWQHSGCVVPKQQYYLFKI